MTEISRAIDSTTHAAVEYDPTDRTAGPQDGPAGC